MPYVDARGDARPFCAPVESSNNDRIYQAVALFDTGATRSIVVTWLAELLGAQREQMDRLSIPSVRGSASIFSVVVATISVKIRDFRPEEFMEPDETIVRLVGEELQTRLDMLCVDSIPASRSVDIILGLDFLSRIRFEHKPDTGLVISAA